MLASGSEPAGRQRPPRRGGARARRSCRALVLGGLLFSTHLVAAEPRANKGETFRCSNPEWLALRSAIDTFCAAHPKQCKFQNVLPLCQPKFRGVTVKREPGFRLRLNPDCWSWWVTLTPPALPEPARSEFRQRPLSELLGAGWLIRKIALDSSSCD